MSGKESAHQKGAGEQPANSKQQAAAQGSAEHTRAQGTRNQHSSLVNFDTEETEGRKTHSTWLRLQN